MTDAPVKKESMADGSKRFILRGGVADGMTVRLYPQNEGWAELDMWGQLYVAPPQQDPKKPYMTAAR